MAIKVCEILGLKKINIKSNYKIKSVKGRLELVRILNSNSRICRFLRLKQ